MKDESNSVPTPGHKHSIVRASWLLSVIVIVIAVIVWGDSLSWRTGNLSTYTLFPLLGLVAFSVMWSHYMVGLIRSVSATTVNFDRYFNWTGYLVLLCLVLHPGLLAFQRFHDGFGLPPKSETSFVAPTMAWVVMLGMVSLLVFLAFEFRRWFRDKKWWFIVPRLGDFAMLAIFYHGLELGTQTHIHWFRPVWWFYGVTLLAVLAYAYIGRLQKLGHSH